MVRALQPLLPTKPVPQMELYKGRGAFSTPICVKKERNVPASADQCFSTYSQSRQLPCAWHLVLKPTYLPLSHLFCWCETYFQNALPQLITWPKLHDEYTRHQWLKIPNNVVKLSRTLVNAWGEYFCY